MPHIVRATSTPGKDITPDQVTARVERREPDAARGPEADVTRATSVRTLREAARDLNDLCSTILGFAALAQDSAAPDTVMAAYMTEIRLSTEAMAAIARQLRALSQELE